MALAQEGFGGINEQALVPDTLHTGAAAPPRPFIVRPGSEYDLLAHPEYGLLRGVAAQQAFQQGGEAGYVAYIQERMAQDPSLSAYAGKWRISLPAPAAPGDPHDFLLPPPRPSEDNPGADSARDAQAAGSAPGSPPRRVPVTSVPVMSDEFRGSLDRYAAVLAARRSSAAGAVARSDARADKYLAWLTRRKGNNLGRQSDEARAVFETALDAELAQVADDRKAIVRQERMRQLEEQVRTSWLQQIGATAVGGEVHMSRLGSVRNRLSGAHWWQARDGTQVLEQNRGNVIAPAALLGFAMGAVALRLPWEFQALGLGAAPAAGATLGGWEAEQANKYRDGVVPAYAGMDLNLDAIEAATQDYEAANRDRYWDAKKVGALTTLIAFFGTEVVGYMSQMLASIGRPSSSGGTQPAPTPTTVHPTPAPTQPPATPPPSPPPPNVPPISYHAYPWTAAQDLLAQHGQTSITPLELVKKAAAAYDTAHGTNLQLVNHGVLPNGYANEWLQWPNKYMQWSDVERFNRFMADHYASLVT